MGAVFDFLRGVTHPQIEDCFQRLLFDCGPELKQYCRSWYISLESASFDDKQAIFCSRLSIKLDSIRREYREVQFGRKNYPEGFELLFQELFSKRIANHTDQVFGKADAIYTAGLNPNNDIQVPSFGSSAPGCYTYTKEFVRQYYSILYHDSEFSQYIYDSVPTLEQFKGEMSSVIRIDEVPIDIENFSLDHVRLLKANLSRLPELQKQAAKKNKFEKEIENNALRKQYLTEYLGHEGRAFDDIDYCLEHLRGLDDYINGLLSTECAKIRRYYPSGYDYFCRHNSDRSYSSIIAHKDEIRSYNQYGDLAKPYDEWEERQKNFTLKCKQAASSYFHTDYLKESSYSPDIERLLINGKIGRLAFDVTSYALSPICKDLSLNYSVLDDYNNYYQQFNQALSTGWGRVLDPGFIKSLLSFVVSIKSSCDSPLLVVIPPSEDEAMVKLVDNEFRGLTSSLKEKGISVLNFAATTDESSFLEYEDLSCYKAVVYLDLLSDNSRWKELFTVLSEYDHFHPSVFVCNSFYTASSEQMKQLISQRKKEIEEAKRKTEEAERAVARRREEQLRKQAAIEKEKKEKAYLASVSHNKKTDYLLFKSYLEDNCIYRFYHFTDKRNLESIKKMGGLFSWHYLEQHNIHIPKPGGNDLSRVNDARFGLEDYVRVSFCRNLPMMYRLEQEGYQLVPLEIKVDVAFLETSRFSNINATDSSQHSYGSSLEDLKKVNISATRMEYVRKDSPYFKEHQAEVLVKTFIPLEYIVNFDELYSMYYDIR